MTITVGVMLCILGIIPLMVAVAFSAPEEVYVYCVAALLVLVAFAVFLFVWAGGIKDSFDMLLQEGDYTKEAKYVRKKLSFFPGAYWCFVTAVFLAAGFWWNDWKYTAYIWPIAALLFVVLLCILKGFFKSRYARSQATPSREK